MTLSDRQQPNQLLPSSATKFLVYLRSPSHFNLVSRRNHCCNDCTDFPDSDEPEDRGCCKPMPVRVTCAAPVLPTPECPGDTGEAEYDPETESFSIWTILFDQNCSPILDENDSPILTEIS